MANEECTHDCSTCSLDCDSKNIDFREKLNEYSSVKKRIAIVSGKGGVGKSFVTSMLASETARRNKKVAILDADITGPSIPKMFGLNGKVVTTEKGWQPVTTKNNIDVISINLMLEDEYMMRESILIDLAYIKGVELVKTSKSKISSLDDEIIFERYDSISFAFSSFKVSFSSSGIG